MKTNCEKNGVFWDVTPCGSCKNTHHIPYQKTSFFIVTAMKTSNLILSEDGHVTLMYSIISCYFFCHWDFRISFLSSRMSIKSQHENLIILRGQSWSPNGVKYSLPIVQTSSGAHPTNYPITVYRGSIPGSSPVGA
jgi:hypothetical protein